MSLASRTCRRIAVAAIHGKVGIVYVYVLYDPNIKVILLLRFKWRIRRGARCYRSDEYANARLCLQLE
jgi:hypothetical protein